MGSEPIVDFSTRKITLYISSPLITKQQPITGTNNHKISGSNSEEENSTKESSALEKREEEMKKLPFIIWIHDLSASDFETTIESL